MTVWRKISWVPVFVFLSGALPAFSATDYTQEKAMLSISFPESFSANSQASLCHLQPPGRR